MGTIFRKSVVISILLFFCIDHISAEKQSNDQEIFLQANELYRNGEIEKALQLYHSVNKKNASVLLNIGNCYYHTNKYIDALVYWKRAQKFMESLTYTMADEYSKLIRHNKENTQNMSWYMHVKNWFAWIATRFSLLTWQLLFLLTWFALWIGYYCVRKFRWVFILLCCSVLICTATIIYVWYQRLTFRFAIALQNESVHIGPNTQFSTCGHLQEFDEVVIVKQNDSWYKISNNNVMGWVPADSLKVVENA